MSKRWISLVLVVLMLASLFLTSCKQEEITVSASDSAKTLTMLVITETQVYYTDAEYAALSADEKAHVDRVREQYAAVEEAINKTTKAKYKTHPGRPCLLPSSARGSRSTAPRCSSTS